MNKITIAIVLIIAVSMTTQVNSQCMKLIPSYHGCFNPDATLTDDYYKSILQNTNTYDAAMDLFRSYYQAVLLTCETAGPICECFMKEMQGEPQYGMFFTNTSHFNDVKRLASLVKYNSKYTLRSMDDINKDPYGTKPFSLETPTLNEFCHKYDYSYHMDIFYTQLKSCKYDSQAIASLKCASSAISGAEAFLKCLYSYRKCDIELKNFLALGDVAKTPSLFKGDSLYSYIESLTNDSVSPARFNNFYFLFSFLLISLYSIF